MMQLDVTLRRTLLIFTLLCLPFVVGSSCIVLFNSGGGSSDNDDKKDDDDDSKDKEFLIVKSGSFSAPVVEGLNYESGAVSGITGKGGEFQYEAGSAVQFAIGELKLGTAVSGKATITPQDIVARDVRADAAALNMARLLLSLDLDPNDGLVTIAPVAREKAVRSNTSVSAAIDLMDYSDEQNFINAASQLLTTLTEDYPFTATLLTADDVRAHLIDSTEGSSSQ